MQPEILVEFIITGTKVFPDEITKAIGLKPSRKWKLGEPIPKTALRRKHNGWTLSSGYYRGLELTKATKRLLKILLSKSDLITRFCRENELECTLACAINITDEEPEINFNEVIISGLAKLNASVDVDIIHTTK